jgi:hypothetical protein
VRNQSCPSDPPVSEVSTLRKFDNVTWTIIGLVAIIVAMSPVVSDFRIDWRSFGLIFVATIGLIAGSWFYRAIRPDLRLSSALECSAQIMAFSAVGAPLSYLAASAGFPLHDQAFDAADKALGFDWMTLLTWLNAHTTVLVVFRAIYLSLMLQGDPDCPVARLYRTTCLASNFCLRVHLRCNCHDRDFMRASGRGRLESLRPRCKPRFIRNSGEPHLLAGVPRPA